MGQLPRQAVSARDFPGLSTRTDPTDLGPGAAREQTNAQSHHPGELRVRAGVRRLTFQEE
jgi:hypothetical protein